MTPLTSPRRLPSLLALLTLACLLVAPAAFAQKKKGGKPDPNDPRHDPANAVKNLDVHPELQATLFASEPAITNPTNLDIDHRGRVWICDVMNYRGNNGRRPAGDRILILEDTDGDGVHDKVKLFHQHREIDSAMGICVLGNKVIVSASPNIFVYHFDEEDKITKKEVLFTKTGQPQHDHSAHSFVFGPDGRLYWNFGNTGYRVHDRNGKLVRDLAGNDVVDNGRPYYGGMVFRCEMDGSNFEVLGHNFRNNYEVAVDSFGTLWQSDNDDDGNKGVRINYVMEFGNYGFRDELTGAGWQSPRTNIEKEIPLRHWHLNDPGVVPNLLQTGAGSPCGICVYEGKLLPEVFRGQVIHADAGPSVVRAYPVERSGAGYKAKIVNILDGNRKNNWFRPADVCVAPDGSLFVTDWYDPGVGGHAQRDSDRGRIFRVAPPDSKYTVPRFDFTTPEGACKALANPADSVRYLAWTALHQMGAKAEPELLKLWKSYDSRLRARALWLLGRIEGKGAHYVQLALKDGVSGSMGPVVGLRLARQLKLDVIPLVEQLVKSPKIQSPEVRRECAIALRHHKAPEAARLWAELAVRYDGTSRDRWELEALGIGADRQWDAYLDAYLALAREHAERKVATWSPAAWSDIVWRSRATRTPELLAKLITNPETSTTELPRYFRAFDFQKAGPEKEKALLGLAFGKSPSRDDEARKNLIAVESIKRLKGADLTRHPEHAATLEKTLQSQRGTQTFVELVSAFGVSKFYPDLLAMAQKQPEAQLGVNAMRALLERDQKGLIATELNGKDPKQVAATLTALTTAADDRATGILMKFAQDGQRDVEARRLAVRALARTKSGAGSLLKLAQSKKLNKDLEQAAGAALTVVAWKNIRDDAAKMFPAPPAKDRPLPPITELAKLRGNVTNGLAVFKGAGTCATCHVVNGEGKEVGPDLSEIGKKLSREALLESILYPSAGISHGYETYVVETQTGGLETGLKVSDTAEGVTLKGADGIVRTVKRDDVARVQRSSVSLMPADLTKTMTAQDLADVVEYMLTLREARAPRGDKK